jgi:predicted nucleic acid-binding Zn ribbon protein
MKYCLNCKITIDLVGDFCSEKCNSDWQELNGKCSVCSKPIDFFEDEFKIRNKGEQEPNIICMTCHELEVNRTDKK